MGSVPPLPQAQARVAPASTSAFARGVAVAPRVAPLRAARELIVVKVRSLGVVKRKAGPLSGAGVHPAPTREHPD